MLEMSFVQEEGFHPFAPGVVAKQAIAQFTEVSEYQTAWLPGLLVFIVGFAEIARANAAWISDERILKSGYKPGNLGFDPLKLYPATEKGQLVMQEKELNNGRCACSH